MEQLLASRPELPKNVGDLGKCWDLLSHLLHHLLQLLILGFHRSPNRSVGFYDPSIEAEVVCITCPSVHHELGLTNPYRDVRAGWRLSATGDFEVIVFDIGIEDLIELIFSLFDKLLDIGAIQFGNYNDLSLFILCLAE